MRQLPNSTIMIITNIQIQFIMKKINLFFLSAIMLLTIAPVSANAQSVDGVSLPSDWTATKSGNIVTLAYSGNNIVKSVKVKYTNICFSVSS